MLIYIDRENKIAYFTDEEEHVYAYYNENIQSDGEDELDSEELDSQDDENEKAGEIETATLEDGSVSLYQIEVEEGYKRQGIGTKLIELAIDNLELTKIHCVEYKISGNEEYSLTGDGERLIASCIRKGIVTPDMCLFGDPSNNCQYVMDAICKINPDFFTHSVENDSGDSGEEQNSGCDSGYLAELEEESSKDERKVEKKRVLSKKEKISHLLPQDSPLSKQMPKKDDSDSDPEEKKEISFSQTK